MGVSGMSKREQIFVGVVVLVVGTPLGGLLLHHLVKVFGGDGVQLLGNHLADDGRPGFEGGNPPGVPDGLDDKGADKGADETKSHRAAKPTVLCDTHSYYSAKDYIRIENDQFVCKHCGAVGTMENDPADGSMAFRFDPKQTPRRLPSVSPEAK